MRTVLAVTLLTLIAVADEENPAQKLLDSVEMGEPLVGKSIVLFPLRLKGAPDDAGVVANTKTDKLSFAEPDVPRRRYNILVKNSGDKPVLLAGGTVLTGGHIDRMIARDHLISAGATAEIRTLPAASSREWRKEPVPFKVDRSLAPVYLRRRAVFGGTQSLVPTFVNKWLEFRDEGDERRSLAAVANSKVLQEYCVADCNKAKIPDVLKDPTLVGAVTAVRGRVQGLVLYRTNALALAYLRSAVHGAAWANAAVVLRAKKLGIPVPGDEEPEKTMERLKKEAAKLFEQVRKARYKADDLVDGEAGKSWIMKTSSGDRGRVVSIDNKVVHLVVYAHDPFESRLYGSKQRVPGEDDDDDPEGTAEISRRAGEGRRLTVAEQRYLERAGMRVHLSCACWTVP